MNSSDPTELAQQAEKHYRYYNSPAVVADYANSQWEQHIYPVEELLFNSHIKPGGAVLDIAVGAGRTSKHLARIASRYVGVDYAPAMIKVCRNRYPQLEFWEMSATDLSFFQDKAFDAVVIARNAIDELLTDEDRRRCLLECWRVLRPNGVLIFSARTPHAILARRTPRMIERYRLGHIAARSGTLSFHIDRIRNFIVAPLALAKITLEKTYLYARKPAFWKGVGYMVDNTGLLLHYATPRKVIAEMSQYGWQLLDTQGGDYPRKTRLFATYFHYYAFSKPA
jgi:ubiquinone/menaquinone biosynthesis C-methylase UbiE